jgi:hypothetical protein
MFEDPIVNEVRRIREDLAEQCDFDVAVLFAGWRSKQIAAGNRLVRRSPERMAEPSAAADAQEAARY